MRIILLRHGEPAIESELKLSPREYGHWLDVFNRASVKDTPLPAGVGQLASQSRFVVCSGLARSVDSARALGVARIDIAEAMFREFEVPYPAWSFPRLSIPSWTVLFRLLWLAGYSAHAESIKSARQRAVLCMERLTGYAEQHGTVLFVGHGSLLWYLHRLLRNNGWQGPAASPRQHWEFGVYQCHVV